MATNRPTGLQIVTPTTGFVETKGSRGACFEWYQRIPANENDVCRDSKWKATHILHEENWMLPNGN